MKKHRAILLAFLATLVLTTTVFAASKSFYVNGGNCVAQLSRTHTGATAATYGATPDYYCYVDVTVYYTCNGHTSHKIESRGNFGEVHITANTPCGTGAFSANSNHRADAPNGQSGYATLSE